MDRIGLDFLSVLGMNPIDYARLAASLDCAAIGIAAAPIVSVPERFAPWSFRDDPALLRDFRAIVADLGLIVAVGEGFFIQPGGDVADLAGDLDIVAEAGARRVTICSFDGERPRAFDQLARFAEMAAARGMGSQVEFVPGLGIADLPAALEAVSHVGREDFGIVIDAMHLFRSGAGAGDVAALPPGAIGHLQLCDVARQVGAKGYGYEASFERLCPGEGELPLDELAAVLPRDRVIALEVPMRDRMLAGEDMTALFAPCVAATRHLLARTAMAATDGRRSR